MNSLMNMMTSRHTTLFMAKVLPSARRAGAGGALRH
ncbi:hypothetical protein A2U01_0079028, partial [Trifolium medium]|nr:hypothetical protein [Trifolium medium]